MKVDRFCIRKVLSRLKELAEVKKNCRKRNIVLSLRTKQGIPMGKLQSQERKTHEYGRYSPKESCHRWDHAVKTVSRSNSIESRSGLSKPGQPIGSFFLLGPTGPEKPNWQNHLLNLCSWMKISLIRFDMSEFKEEHSAALLLRRAPGICRIKEDAYSSIKSNQQLYAVVLFDEIEKHMPLSSICSCKFWMKEGLHDRLGKEGDFV